MKVKRYLLNVDIAFDLLLNTLFLGNQGESLGWQADHDKN